jgi:hypothetical protein
MDEETKEVLLRFANNVSRAQHGSLDNEEDLQQLLDDLTTLTSAPPRREERKDARAGQRPGGV